MADKPLQSLNFPGRDYTYVNTPLSTAPTFDNTVAYAIGDYVFYNMKLYKFTSAHTAGAWDNSQVVEITIGNEIKQIENDLNDKYEKPSTGIPASDLAQGVIPEVPVQDVQVNGASILNQGVANVPLADGTNAGVVKVGTSRGIRIIDSGNNIGELFADAASENAVKLGVDTYRPLVPSKQDRSTFYGLAKAAGDTTQASSSNAVGTYTEDAKIKIQKMLGIYEAPWELIREDTFTNETEADHEITVDGNGEPLDLTDIIMLFELPRQSVKAKKAYYGQIHYYYTDSKYVAPEPGAFSVEANADPKGFKNFIEKRGDLVLFYDSAPTTTTNRAGVGYRYLSGFNGEAESIRIIPNFSVIKIRIKSVTGTGHYKLFGRRKWS